MKTVSRRSLHYRLWKRVHPYSEPRNLCRYFWACFFLVVAPLVLGALVLFAIGTLVYIIGTNLAVSGIVVSSITVAIVAIFALVKLIQWQGHRVKSAARNTVYVVTSVKRKEPGLIRSFLKAKKQKVCPMIEVVD